MLRLQSRPIITACVVWLVALAAVLNASTTLRPVPYRDVKSIVLDAGKQTLGRRSTVPQMAYVGGDGRYAPFLPTTMQCTNTGWSGDQFTWACQAQLPPGVDLDRVEVACEDWDPPVNDPTESDTMTAGSCGVEYTLRGTPPSPTPPPPVIQHVVHQTSPAPAHVQHVVHHAPSPAPPTTTTTVHHYGSPWTFEEVKTILSFGAAALLIMLVVVCCMACDSQSSRSSAPAPQPQPAPPVVVIDEPAPLVVETADGDTAYARPLRRSQRRVVVEQAAPAPPPVYVAPAPAPIHYTTTPAPPPVYVALAPVYAASAPATVVIDNRRSTSAARSDGFIDGMITGSLLSGSRASSSSSSWGGGGSTSTTTHVYHSAAPAPSTPAPAPSTPAPAPAASTHTSTAFGGTKRR